MAALETLREVTREQGHAQHGVHPEAAALPSGTIGRDARRSLIDPSSGPTTVAADE